MTVSRAQKFFEDDAKTAVKPNMQKKPLKLDIVQTCTLQELTDRRCLILQNPITEGQKNNRCPISLSWNLVSTPMVRDASECTERQAALTWKITAKARTPRHDGWKWRLILCAQLNRTAWFYTSRALQVVYSHEHGVHPIRSEGTISTNLTRQRT